MTKAKRTFIALMMTMLLPFCSGTGTPVPASAKKIDNHFKKFITLAELETAGFEHIDGAFFILQFKDEDFYILNFRDYLIAKFRGLKLQCIFKTKKGQAPKEMIVPISLFLYDDDTIAVFDSYRFSVILFDYDLNYIKETKLNYEFKKMARVGKNLVAMLNYKQENVFAMLDKDFKILQTVVEANKTIPAEHFYRSNLNSGYFLDEKLVSHSYSLFPYKQCKVDIYNMYTGELVTTLHWEQPFSPTAKSINESRNIYFIHHVGKYGPYYAVHNSHSKTLVGSVRHYDFLIFDQEGKLIYRGDFPNRILKVSKDTMDSKLYFMDDDEGISYIDIEEFLK